MPLEKEEEIIEFVKHGAQVILKNNPKADLVPVVFYKKGKEVNVMAVHGGRDAIRATIDMVEAKNPDWIASINEGYSRAFKKPEEMPKGEWIPGVLEMQYKLGSEAVKEIVWIQVRVDDRNPVGVMLEKRNGELVNEMKMDKDIGGFLALKKKRSDKDLGDVL